jgi:hypothetical protein
MMIQAVLLFAALSAAFEFAVLMKIKPRTRLRILGSSRTVGFIHLIVITFNICLHYGTVVGTMTAVVAGLASFAAIPLARYISGYIIKTPQGEKFKPGIITYQIKEIV